MRWKSKILICYAFKWYCST